MPDDQLTNSHGPAEAPPLSPELAASWGLTPNPGATAPAEPVLIPADQVKPEDIAKLSIEYRGGQPVIVVSGGTVVPVAIQVVDTSGEPVIAYVTAPWQDAAPRKSNIAYVALDLIGRGPVAGVPEA